MADYFLDTNACIALINKRPEPVRQRLARAIAQGLAIGVSSVAVFELWYGVNKSSRRDFNTARLETFLGGPVEIVAFDEEDARVAGLVRAELERLGTPIGAYDVLIASQAKRHGATLVTSNVSECGRVTDLRLEDWTVTEEASDQSGS